MKFFDYTLLGQRPNPVGSRTVPCWIAVLLAFTGLAFADDLDEALDAEESAQTATSITIIFDNSGSMAENRKLDQAKKAFTSWLQSLPPNYSLGLIHFNVGKAVLAVPTGRDNRDKLLSSVNKLKPYGKTPVAGCLKIANGQIATRRGEFSPYERHVVVVFTDGIETVDKRGNKGVVQEIQSLRDQKIEVVGIGFHGQGDYMKPAATTFFHASDEKELVAGLTQVDAEIGDDSDIEISEKDLAAIAKADIPLPKAPAEYVATKKK